MIKKSSAILTLFVCAVILLGVKIILADDQEMPDDILLSNPDYETDRKGPVAFSHISHSDDYEIDCEECHHMEEDPVQKCADCHDPNQNQDQAKKLSTTFHKTCKACHREIVRSGDSKRAPFRKCSGCHSYK